MLKRAMMILFLLLMMTLCCAAAEDEGLVYVDVTDEVTQLEDGFSAVLREGDDYFADFLAQGGASSDMEIVQFLAGHLLGANDLTMQMDGFACSSLSVEKVGGGWLYGRNFDWNTCDAMVVVSRPEGAYASISTVNMDFLGSVAGILRWLPQSVYTLAAHYAPLDGMNEKGLCAAVLMISDGRNINQRTEKPDITTTTAIRLLLNQAANVDEALALLEQYDMHASMGLMVHFAIADADGNSVVVEYINNEMVVIQTPVVTNFYLVEGELHGIVTQQSHTRYDRLTERLARSPQMTKTELRDTMDSVSKHHFGDHETTEWTMICDQTEGEVHYYHRENYDYGYVFSIR